tara:strand:+ start:609 stop:971 length:363 start_codon:yes stop_codon:yes gene_type:complete
VNATKIDRKDLIRKTRRPLPPPTRRIDPDKGGKYTRKKKHKDKDDRWTEDGIYLLALYDIVICDTIYHQGRPEKVEPFIESAQYEGFDGDEDRPLTQEEIDNIPHSFMEWIQEQIEESDL